MARKYPMTTEEIVASYRQAKNQQMQIGVLADLNVCTKKEIRQLLAEAGVLEPLPEKRGGRPATYDTALARRLFADGLADAEIAAQVGIPAVRLARWRQREGLYRNGVARPAAPSAPTEENRKTVVGAGDPARPVGHHAAGSGSSGTPTPTLPRIPKKEENGVEKKAQKPAAEKAVTVDELCALLREASEAGYGGVPVAMAGRRFTALHLRAETLIGAEVKGGVVEIVPDAPQIIEDARQ